jgi:hypothetical protein
MMEPTPMNLNSEVDHLNTSDAETACSGAGDNGIVRQGKTILGYLKSRAEIDISHEGYVEFD